MNVWRGLIKNLRECLFPVFCLGCSIEGEWYCEKCFKELKNFGVFYCPVCHSKNSDGSPCNNCQVTTSLNRVVAFFDYEEKSIFGRLIKHFKYDFAYDIESVWKKIIQRYLENIFKKLEIEGESLVIVPVPLHPRRLRERGFNQAEIIGRIIFEQLQKFNKNEVIFEVNGLRRTRVTSQQAKLNRVERIANIKNAFVWKGKNLDNKAVILVDDVYTSGSTMNECGRILKLANVKGVFGLALGRD